MDMRQNYEAALGPQIAWALAHCETVDDIEVDGIFFEFEVDKQRDETESHRTGVSFMGDCESYTCTTHRARIKYVGAYEIGKATAWDPCGDDPRDVEIDLDMDLLARCIEEQDDDCDKFIISIAA